MVWSFACTLLTLHTPRAQNRNRQRPPIFQRYPHVWHCTHHDHQTEKQQSKYEKTQGGSQRLVYTLRGTSFTRHTKHILFSLPCCLTRSNHMQQHSRGTGNGKLQTIDNFWHVAVFANFVATPKRVVTTNKCFLTFCNKNILSFCTMNIHQLRKKCENSK